MTPGGTQALLGRWTALLRRRARLVIGLWLMVVVASAVFAATNLGINTSTADIISEDVPYRQNNLAFKAAFPQFSDLLVIVADAPTPEQAEDAIDRLEARLLEHTDLFASVYDPAGEPFFRRNGLLFLDLEALTALADRIAGAQAFLASLAADPSLNGLWRLLADAMAAAERGEALPGELASVVDRIAETVEARADGGASVLSWRRLLSGDAGLGTGARRFLLARPAINDESLSPAGAAIAAARDAVAELGLADAGITVRFTGPPALETEELATVSAGAGAAGLLSLVLVSVLLYWGIRSGRQIVAILITLLVGLVTTAGFAALAIGHLNMISVAFAVLFVGLAVDFGIHFVLRYREELGRSEPAAALAAAMGGVGPSLALASLCAAVGFLSFVPTNYQGLAELGIISAGGMAIALIANTTLLPALLTLMGSRTRPRPLTGSALGVLVVPARRPILVVAGLVSVAAAAAALSTRFDVNPLNLQDPTLESVATYRSLATDPDTTPYLAQFIASDLEAAANLADRLRTLDQVERVISPLSFVPDDQDAKFAVIDEMALFLTAVLFPGAPDGTTTTMADLQSALRGALDREDAPLPVPLQTAVARLHDALETYRDRFGDDAEAHNGLENDLIGTLPRWIDDLSLALEADLVTLDSLPDSLHERWFTADGRVRVEAAPTEDVSDPAAMRRFAEAVRAISDTVTGAPVTVTEASAAVVDAFIAATAIAIVAILVILAVIQRRVSDVALTLLPLILAALWTLAASVLFDLPLNFANVIVLPLLFGLGVASSIHLVMRRREGAGASVVETSTPRAVLFSALTTMASFGSLAISAHRGMSSMGLLLTIAISLTLVATLVVLPCLMASVDQWAKRRHGP